MLIIQERFADALLNWFSFQFCQGLASVLHAARFLSYTIFNRSKDDLCDGLLLNIILI